MKRLLQLRLPLKTRAESRSGLAFQFLADAPNGPRIVTGHAQGAITINLAEADDAERERRRHAMGELYRTLLGHFREIGHYYWDRLVANTPHLNEYRRVFGDERLDYDKALQQHYASGVPADWSKGFISAYASSHPGEDFAETSAHCSHVIDTLKKTAEFCGLVSLRHRSRKLGAVFNFHPLDVDLNHLVDSWIALTFAVNYLNRSMGLPDLIRTWVRSRDQVGFGSASDCKCGDNLATWSTDDRACAGLSRRWVGQTISTPHRGEGQ